MVSQTFITAIKLSPRRAYQIAHEAGVHPSTLSAILNGIVRIRRGDPRVIAVAKVLGLSPTECFSEGECVRK